MIKDYLSIPWKEVKRRKLRSFLTLIGIIIGITAVISLITLGQGLENAITQQFSALGNDKLFITAKGNTLTPGLAVDAISITEKDLDVIKSVTGVKQATGFIFSTAKIEFNDNVRYFIIFGQSTNPAERELIGESQNYVVETGRSLQKGDKNKVVLGYDYQEESLFGKSIELNDKIKIHDQEFKVIGFLGKIGSPPDDRSAGISLEVYQDLFETEELGMLVAQTQPGDDPEIVAEKITKELRNHRGLEEGKEDFSIQTPEQLASTFGVILDIVNLVLIGIAAISILVGGIGIMNTMYTTVLERTKEIGIMKALGAQRKHIMYLFLVESGLYGLGGGIVGVLVGISFAKLVEFLFIIFIGPAFLSIEIDWLLVIGTLFFSFIIGALSGISPARKAATLDPVDSLRYE